MTMSGLERIAGEATAPELKCVNLDDNKPDNPYDRFGPTWFPRAGPEDTKIYRLATNPESDVVPMAYQTESPRRFELAANPESGVAPMAGPEDAKLRRLDLHEYESGSGAKQ